ncbi:MAG: hypothetical protein ACLTTH_16510 [Holdemanella porci]
MKILCDFGKCGSATSTAVETLDSLGAACRCHRQFAKWNQYQQ